MFEPRYPARDSVCKLSPFEPKLKQWLSIEHKKPKRWRRNLRSIYWDLVALSFTQSYDRVMRLRGCGKILNSSRRKCRATCLVYYESNRYGVPASYANKTISLRIYADKLVMASKGQHIAEHPRLFGSGHARRGHTQYTSLYKFTAQHFFGF